MHLTLHQGGIMGTKIIYAACASMGFKVNMREFVDNGETIQMTFALAGRKPFEAGYFSDILQESGIVVRKGSLRNRVWNIEADGAASSWNLPVISVDEGGQMSKSQEAQWFALSNVPSLNIEAPYGGKWYPEIALLNAQMEVLTSYKEYVAKDHLTFALPEGSRYLKVSNASGMKLLREGTWIEYAQE